MTRLHLTVFATFAVGTVGFSWGQTGIAIQDKSGSLRLRLNVGDGCSVDRLEVRGRQVLDAARGMSSGIRAQGRWYTSRELQGPPKVSAVGGSVRVDGIRFGGGGVLVSESWLFTPSAHSVKWKIDRTYLSSGTLDDTAMPMMTFRDMSTWTGAILGTGGVAWGKLFDAPNATYGIHTGSATFWNAGAGSCLRFAGKGANQALRFTREPDGAFTMASEPTQVQLKPRYGKARFRRGEQDIWAGFAVAKSDAVSATCELTSPDFEQTMGRGEFKGLDTGAITELLNTIGRIGVIDEKLVGSNGWYSGYVCLHEPWLGAVGIAIDDPNYVRNYARALDDERDHAILPDGMVKSRWCYYDYDAQPGTYDKNGYYEAQWGRLMDSQSSYVTDVADEFDLNGDLAWVRGQKRACESALDYLLRRDTNGNGLVEMANDSLTQRRSSDWLDIVWASYENALVNAQLYGALNSWSKVERLLGDPTRAASYRAFAAKLKTSYNKPITQGGFWDPSKGWYAYWREKDGSIHGDNLVIPVNLSALVDGLCDDPHRRATLLDTIEKRMQAESLLCWPSCFEPYSPGEAANTKWPDYENGDIFLSWAAYGIRAYAADRPAVALKYVRQIVEQYKKDGLAFQRYLRSDGKGAGDDILANNCTVILGLYRDVYGIQPRYDRLYLAPHLTPELNGTRVRYRLRGQPLDIDLSVNRYTVARGAAAISAARDFGVDFGPNRITYFAGSDDTAAFTIEGAASVDVRSWEREKRWSVTGGTKPAWITQTFLGLKPGSVYTVVGLKSGSRVSASHPSIRALLPARGRLTLRLVPVWRQ